MSTMMRSDRKPPLAMRSPIRLRPRRGGQTTMNNHLQTPSAPFTKSCRPKQQSLDMEEPELRPEYHTISSELRALTKMVQDNLRGSTDINQSSTFNGTPLFERGRFYDEYSARRNERLRRKRGETGVEKKSPCKQYLGVKTESTKRTAEVKKFESAKKMSAAATPLVERREAAMTTQRYSLRSSSKENKKPPLAISFDRSIGGTVEKKTAMKRTARKGY